MSQELLPFINYFQIKNFEKNIYKSNKIKFLFYIIIFYFLFTIKLNN